MSICKNPSSQACLKFNPQPGKNFCQACGGSAAALGAVVAAPGTSVGAPTVVTSRTSLPPVYAAPLTSTANANKFLNVVKPQLNQQALKGGLIASLHAQRAQRIPATVSSGLMAAAGVLIGLGLSFIIFNVIASGDEPPQVMAFLLGLLCLTLAWAIACWLPDVFKSTGVVAANILVPVVAIVSFATQVAEGNVGIVLLFAALLTAVLFVLPGTAGRPSLQALGIAYASWALLSFSVQDNISFYLENWSDLGFSDAGEIFQGSFQTSGTLGLILGALLLGVGHRFDRQKWSNVATPFIANGIILVLLGALSIAENSGSDDGSSATGPIILFVAISVGLTYVGGYAGRRFTLILGSWLITVGLVGLTTFMAGSEPDPVTLALLFVIVGAAISFAVFKNEKVLSKWTTPRP